MTTSIYQPEHEAFRGSVRTFLEREVVPHFNEWEKSGKVPHDFYTKVGDLGLFGLRVPEEYGGGGLENSFLYQSVWTEECSRAGVALGGVGTHANLVIPYILANGSPEQKKRWLPDMVDGRRMGAIAMTEPATGSDLAGMRTSARKDGGDWVLNGQKTFITGGINADLVIVAARTSTHEERRKGLSLFVVESHFDGFSRGRNLEKMGQKATDTAELFFEDVRVPMGNLLGEEGAAFSYLAHNLVGERLGIALGAQVSAETALRITIDYVKERKVFGQPVAGFQNTKFELASCRTEIAAGRALIDQYMLAHEAGELTASEASMAKVYCTELQSRVIDRCLQLHGGYGFMSEYRISRMYTDSRISRIYGGTNEVQRGIIAKSIGL
ncbi:acyl-CoA dehydrogenase family protein (plasmid) [Rhodococcus pyridinivorans]|uniref:acyl-CoA dehydrogenase family protein n=1 Tax=Rhodococcus TaxID=1827 RepID=UPI0007D91DB9|nr:MULTISPECIES: acyl-CoA dehydrogenase family protein [Rhodococcus]MCT7293658.1 acyl-CoA dehydrogenase family protein [Rhodococcus sp. PAE-6]QXU56441.1 acyl-CoA dehydrogenase family protein [Rhodococcus sp. LW-XY12]UQB75811.1 acyl-CoA dehydrogenase family protein [Rhodococcus ruber]UVT27499.1 acyl-CoA dehydrogenase family protein [Rhodococcus pyridinivorans]WML66338.1 acyl-CoA dehydrogenase family protein [Rhodococcus sp. AH-ZY2]